MRVDRVVACLLVIDSTHTAFAEISATINWRITRLPYEGKKVSRKGDKEIGSQAQIGTVRKIGYDRESRFELDEVGYVPGNA